MKASLRAVRSAWVAAAVAALVAACGGSSGSDRSAGPTPTPGPTPAPTTLVGTAATGAAIEGSVVAIDVNGKASPKAQTNAETGAYTVDVSGLTAPYLLTVVGHSGGRQVVLTSVATAAGQTVNLTPLTDLIVSSAAGVAAGSSLVEACTPGTGGSVAASCLDALKAATAGTKLKEASAKVAAMIAPLNAQGTDPLTGSFKADGKGLDGVLDRLLVTPDASGQVVVTLVGDQSVLGQLSTSGGLEVKPPPSAAALQQANAASEVLPAINACLKSFNNLYPKAGFAAPSQNQVAPFVADDFSGFGASRDQILGFLAGGQAPAVGGFTLKALALARREMSPLNAAEIAILTNPAPTVTNRIKTIFEARENKGAPVRLDDAGQAVSAWVRLSIEGDSDVHRFVKGAPYTGCESGWRWAGTGRADLHMNARVVRDEGASGAEAVRRLRAFHLETGDVDDATPGVTIRWAEVRGPGIVSYSGNPDAPVGAAARLNLVRPSPNSLVGNFVIANSTFYNGSEALMSCKDVAAATAQQAPSGTPCIDEDQVKPGAIYVWALKQNADGSGDVNRAFPFEINAVPLSKQFVLANAKDVFATITDIVPGSVSAVNQAIAAATGATLENVFRVRYTQGSAYGSKADNCNLALHYQGGNAALRAETGDDGQENQCTFVSARLNSGGLGKPSAPIAAGVVSVATQVLGNQVITVRHLGQ